MYFIYYTKEVKIELLFLDNLYEGNKKISTRKDN